MSFLFGMGALLVSTRPLQGGFVPNLFNKLTLPNYTTSTSDTQIVVYAQSDELDRRLGRRNGRFG